jgi:Serine dehydrogenase proteinase
MDYATRQDLYAQIERDRKTKVITYVTSDRVGMETQIAQDCIDLFVDLLDLIGPTPKISLILHTNGGQTSAAWRLVNLVRTFCDELEVLIPLKALSAGTLISLGSDRIVMTKQAALGPIDPSLNHPLNPQIPAGNQLARVPVSVEAVRGYLEHHDRPVQQGSSSGAGRNLSLPRADPVLGEQADQGPSQERYQGEENYRLSLRGFGQPRLHNESSRGRGAWPSD